MLAVLWLAVAPLVSMVAQQPSDAADIRALELKMLDCYKNRQVEVFAAVLDEDFVITFEDGTTYSKTGYLSYSASASTRVESVEIPEMKIRMHGDTAVVTGVNHVKGKDEKGVAFDSRFRFTDTWTKRDGYWQAWATQGTRIP